MLCMVDSPNKHCEVLLSCSDREIWNCMEMHASLWNCMEAWVTLGNLLETWNKADFHMGHYFDNQPLGKIYYKDKYASDYIEIHSGTTKVVVVGVKKWSKYHVKNAKRRQISGCFYIVFGNFWRQSQVAVQFSMIKHVGFGCL